jgi:hypothetical protein
MTRPGRVGFVTAALLAPVALFVALMASPETLSQCILFALLFYWVGCSVVAFPAMIVGLILRLLAGPAGASQALVFYGCALAIVSFAALAASFLFR